MKLKDKKIELLAVTNAKDADGFNTEIFTQIAAPVWAYYRSLSGKEIYANSTVQAVEDVQFVINYRTDLTTRHVIRYRGELYDIVRIDDFQGYKQDLTVYCSLRKGTGENAE